MSFLWHIASLLLLHSCTPGLMVDGIVGGKVSIPHSRPYMVYIRDSKSEALCGGFLVGEDYVMTAAHCKGRLLKTPATLIKTVKTIALPKKENPKHAVLKDCMVSGWGLQDYGRGSPSRVLKEASVTLLDSKNCGTPDTLCSEGTTGPVEGDGGGPLVCGDVAHGIVSYYKKESNGEYRTRYTDISQYLPWIHSMGDLLPPPIQENEARKAGFTTGPIGPVPGGDASKEEFSTTSSLAISDEPEHQHQPDKTENPSPAGVTDTYSSAPPPPPPPSPTPLETETEAGASEAAEGGRDPAVTGLMVDGIVGGKVSIPHSRPYMVYIRDSKSETVCGGFLVGEDYVMTAAHCKGSHLKVYLGVSDTNFLPDGVAVDPIPHPQFKSNTPGHDIMLLKLKTPATLIKTVKTIALPKKENPKHAVLKDCMVSGWGLQDYGRGSPSRVLKEASVTLLDSKNCGTPDTLCSEGTTGPVEGDGGGPLVCGDVAHGIVSYYKKESNGEYRTRYTDISQYLPWIHSMGDLLPPPIQENEARKAGFTTGPIGPVPGGDASKEEFSTTSSLAISDEPEHQHQPDKTENPSPAGVTDTYSSAPPPPPPPSPTPLETETEAGASEAAEGGRDPAVTGLMVDGIVGGKVSIPHSRPYMVYIRDSKSETVCGGFLVGEDYVMTAAHCKGSHLKVYLGVSDTNFLPDGVAVDPIPHPQFKSNTPGHDIMLLKLKTPATLIKTVKTIALPKKENPKHAVLKDCMVSGWGLQDYGRGSPSRVLKEASVTLLDSKNCGTPDTLCSEGTTGPVEGDGGGPLVCGDVAHGIVSYYKKESNGEYRTRYTDISQYLPWIHSMGDLLPPPIQENEASKGKLHLFYYSNRIELECLMVDGIVGGKVSIPHSRPYMVYIRDSKSETVCGGFLVGEDYVMTAAHCKGSHLKVYLGVSDTNFLPDGVAVDPIPHPQFKSNTPGHDIMLLKLKTPATLIKTVKTIALPKKENPKHAVLKDCMVSGWGLQDYGRGSPSRVLKEASVTLLDSKNCGTPDTLCSEGTTGPVEGDGGGPLVCGDVAHGIVSYYKKESNGEYRTRYTDISQYLPWIHSMGDLLPPPIQENEARKAGFTTGPIGPVPGGDASKEEFSTTSCLAISDEPEHQHQPDKTENPSPAGVTDTYSSAPPPPPSPTPLETETEAGASEAAEGGRDPAVTGFSVVQDGIVDSDVSIPHSRPYMVYIRDSKSKAVCVGFLVREDFVMTAASCKTSHLKVYLGVNDTNFLPDGVAVLPIPHPQFKSNTPGHDIMLLKLETQTNLNKAVHTITLPKNSSENISKDCMVMGWGLQESNVLKANVTLLDSKNCGTPDTLCSEGTTRPAEGASGSPLVCGDVAQGISSYYKQESNGEPTKKSPQGAADSEEEVVSEWTLWKKVNEISYDEKTSMVYNRLQGAKINGPIDRRGTTASAQFKC
ncbi:unnamed protein product [Leuciscus chuanchicus]